MSSTKLFTTFAALLAASTVVGAVSVKARQTVTLVYVTTGADFTGDQLFQSFTPGDCFDFPLDWQDTITSIATVDTAICTFWQGLDCPVGADTITVTNTTTIPDLGDGDYPGWDDAIKSATCTV